MTFLSLFAFFKIFQDHAKLAKIIFAFIFIVAITGSIVERFYLARSSKLSIYKQYTRMLHGLTGMLLWLFIKLQMFYIRSMMTGDKVLIEPLLWVSLIGFPIIVVTLKFLFSLRSLRKPNLAKRVKNLTEEQSTIVKRLKSGATREQMLSDFPSKFVFLFEDKIVDMSDYIHPGGDIFYRNQNWREISRFLYGGRSDERTGASNSHSAMAFAALSSRIIGSLDGDLGATRSDSLSQREKDGYQELQNLDKTTQNSTSLRWSLYGSYADRIKYTPQSDWIVSSKDTISSAISIVKLTQPKYTFKISQEGVNWFGRFFYLRLDGDYKALGVAAALTPEASSYREELIKLIDGANNNERQGKIPNVLSVFSNVIPLVVRNTKSAQMAERELATAMQGKIFKLDGPYGNGLGVPRSFSGRCVIISEGAGYASLVDFFDFLLKKTAFLISENLAENGFSQYIRPEQDYRGIWEHAVFRYYGIVDKLVDLPVYDLIKKLNQLNQKHSFSLFKARLFVKNASSGQEGNMENSQFNFGFFEVDETFLKENILEADIKVGKVVLSGGAEFYQRVSGLLDGLGYPKGRVTYM